MKQIIALNSGGFDSTVLLHELVKKAKEEGVKPQEILSIFFRYGQANCDLEGKCASNNAKKLGVSHLEITLPNMNWSHSTMFSNNENNNVSDEAQYIEWRNLIFLSYALSIAESNGAHSIYTAILKSSGFVDTSKEFLININAISKMSGIEILAPFSEYTKIDLGYLARSNKIKREDFFSCNVPIKNAKGGYVPCNKCGDCKTLNEVYSEIVEDNTPIKAFFNNNYEKFKELYRQEPITEIRLLTNNECQFNCSHCFYGFKDMQGKKLTDEQIFDLLKQADELGIKNIHFSGKEPLINTDIFKYADFINKNTNMTWNVVTNGINVFMFLDKLKNYNCSRIFLSVDSLNGLKYMRNTQRHIINTINSIVQKEIPLEIFIDVEKENCNQVREIIRTLIEHDVKNFYIREVMPLGINKEDTKNKLVSVPQLEQLLEDLVEDTQLYKENAVNVTFVVKNKWCTELKGKTDTLLSEALQIQRETGLSKINDHITILGQYYCAPFEDNVTITPDGFALGCGTEVSSQSYNNLYDLNIKNMPLKEVIKRGKEVALNRFSDNIKKNNGEYVLNTCYHTNI